MWEEAYGVGRHQAGHICNAETQRPVDLDSASPGGTRAKWEAVPKSTLEINKTTKKQ